MISHDVGLLEVSGDHRSSDGVLSHSAHVPDSIHLFDVQVVQFFKVLFEFGLGKFLLDFKGEGVIIDFDARPPEDDAMLEEFVLWVFFGEIGVFGRLFRCLCTSSP